MANNKERIIPTSEDLLMEATRKVPQADINKLHAVTFGLMKKYRDDYYNRKVDEILSEINAPSNVLNKVKEVLLKPVNVDGVEYSNPMEEASRRVSQSFQPISGNLAELCGLRELEKVGLIKDVNFKRRENRTDITVYYPRVGSSTFHRVEVKNVHLRERGVRGLTFDGDSMLGFFIDAYEFTKETVDIIDTFLSKSRGYCYIPPDTIDEMRFKGRRFRVNTKFGDDMHHFAKTGKMP